MKRKRPKPIIGVTGPDKGGAAAWWFTWFAVWIQGGQAVRIRPSRNFADLSLDGLIIGGGADINPERYGEPLLSSGFRKRPKPEGFRQWFIRIFSFLFSPFIFLIRKILSTKSSAIDDRRDDLEFGLLEKALADGIPVLGICRGFQLINVQLGGTLHQKIDTFYTEVPRVHSIWPKKQVEIKNDSKLGKIVNASKIWVNALHYQAVDKAGGGLTVVAQEKNGISQAIEHANYRFLIGVQWHPEYMPQIPRQRNIFKKLVEEAVIVMSRES